MKIKDILGEEDVTITGVAGDKAKLSNGQEIDAKTLTPDSEHPGEFKAPETDPNALKPGAKVNMGDDATSESHDEEDHPGHKHYDDWMHSEHAPHDDDSGDENKVFQKAINFLSHRPDIHPGDIEYHAHHMTNKFHGMEEAHHDTIASGNHDVGGDATDRLINQVRDKEFERKNRMPGSGSRSPLSTKPAKLPESDELMKWLTVAGIK